MEPIKISAIGQKPITYSTTDKAKKAEREWCQFVAQKAAEYAVTDLTTIPLEATFIVTLHFYRGLEKRMYDADNLAKPVIDTLFYGRKKGSDKPRGVLFPNRLPERKDLDDFYVFDLHIVKHIEGNLEKQGVDITIEIRDEIVNLR